MSNDVKFKIDEDLLSFMLSNVPEHAMYDPQNGFITAHLSTVVHAVVYAATVEVDGEPYSAS